MADKTTLKRVDFLYRVQAGINAELDALDTAMKCGRMSVRVDFVTANYTGPHDIPLTDVILPHVGALVREQLLTKLRGIDKEINDLGFEA